MKLEFLGKMRGKRNWKLLEKSKKLKKVSKKTEMEWLAG